MVYRKVISVFFLLFIILFPLTPSISGDVEDFTTWVENDPLNRFTTNATTITITGLIGNDVNTFISKDFGINYFNGDFTIDFDLTISTVDGANQGIFHPILMTNIADDYTDIRQSGGSVVGVRFLDSGLGEPTTEDGYLMLTIVENGVWSQPFTHIHVNQGTPLYLRYTRVGKLHRLAYYTDATRTEYIGSITKSTVNSYSWQYIVLGSTYGFGGDVVNGYLEYIDVGIEYPTGAAPTYQSFSIDPLVDGDKIMTGGLFWSHATLRLNDTDGGGDITKTIIRFPRGDSSVYTMTWTNTSGLVVAETTGANNYVLIENPSSIVDGNSLTVTWDFYVKPGEPTCQGIDVDLYANSTTGGELAYATVLTDYFNLIPYSIPSPGGGGSSGGDEITAPDNPPSEDGFDTDGDGVIDSWDTDGDGDADAFDTDGDGTEDTWDTNDDGIPDSFDTDGDGDVDVYDTDGDGVPDTDHEPYPIERNPSDVTVIQNPFGDKPILIYPYYRWTPAQKMGVPAILSLLFLLALAALVKKYLDDRKKSNRTLETKVRSGVYEPLRKMTSNRGLKRKYLEY